MKPHVVKRAQAGRSRQRAAPGGRCEPVRARHGAPAGRPRPSPTLYRQAERGVAAHRGAQLRAAGAELGGQMCLEAEAVERDPLRLQPLQQGEHPACFLMNQTIGFGSLFGIPVAGRHRRPRSPLLAWVVLSQTRVGLATYAVGLEPGGGTARGRAREPPAHHRLRRHGPVRRGRGDHRHVALHDRARSPATATRRSPRSPRSSSAAPACSGAAARSRARSSA